MPGRVLIVDDEENLRTSLAQAFRLEGYEVATAASAQEALEGIRGATYDVLLTDLMMPHIDGLTLLDRVRLQLPEAVVILMTGQATVGSAVRALKGGAYDYILKPFKLEEIFHVVRRALEQQRLKRENLHLVEINRRMQEIDQIKSDLLSTITHEFRTPLTIIYGWLDLLLGNHFGALTPGQQESLQAIRQSSLRLGRLISNLLTYVEFERGEVSLQPQEVAVRDLLQSLLAQVASEAQEKEVAVTLTAGADLPPVVADPEKMQILFFNLVENAIKFNERRGGLRVEAGPVGPGVEVAITNTRGSIPMDRVARLMQPFSQGDMSMTRVAGGLGLGLAVAKAIVDAYKGELLIESGPGSGTTVRVRLPGKGPR